MIRLAARAGLSLPAHTLSIISFFFQFMRLSFPPHHPLYGTSAMAMVAGSLSNRDPRLGRSHRCVPADRALTQGVA